MTRPRTWDLFCRVIDNYGDVGVCWRLARRLLDRGAQVRLWLDDLASLAPLVAALDAAAPVQRIDGIAVHRWGDDWPPVAPADVCIEGFGCGLPEPYVEAAAARGTLWIVLEYLSAESWVGEHHGLPSPHPRHAVQRYFYFPGFEAQAGGLLREPELFAARDRHDAAARAAYWQELGFPPPPSAADVVCVFGYENAPLLPLLEHWTRTDTALVLAVPVGGLAARAAAWFGVPARPGLRLQRGALELRVLPFVPQREYDRGLWSADVLFVRGEDSFVRAQWAARPFVWQIYAQPGAAHHVKLAAFLARYTRGLDPDAAIAVRAMWAYWNGQPHGVLSAGAVWEAFRRHRKTLEAHGQAWALQLAEHGELAENLAEFCASKLK